MSDDLQDMVAEWGRRNSRLHEYLAKRDAVAFERTLGVYEYNGEKEKINDEYMRHLPKRIEHMIATSLPDALAVRIRDAVKLK